MNCALPAGMEPSLENEIVQVQSIGILGYKCNICGIQFQEKEGLIKHKKVHTIKRPFKCATCGKAFGRKDVMRSHETIHTGERAYKCETCGKTFRQYASLHRHRIIHTGDKKHHCDICGKSFAEKKALRIHTLFHTGEKPYRCDICGKGFITSGKVKVHKRIHTGEKPYPCLLCEMAFATKMGLKSHFRTHTNERPYKCDGCGKGFNRKTARDVHMFNHSCSKKGLSAEGYKCDLCGNSFFYKSLLDRHFMTHTGEKPHKCEICGNSFHCKSGLINHTRIHTGEKPYGCTICGKAFAIKFQLKVHIMTHTGEKPFQCDTCGKGFRTKGQVKIHMRKHTGEKPFQCSICDLTFAQQYQVEVHEKVHTISVENMFQRCPICGRTFVTRSRLQDHITAKHTEQIVTHKEMCVGDCSMCNLSFSEMSALRAHEKVHDVDIKEEKKELRDAEKIFTCSLCEKTFTQVMDYIDHIPTHPELADKKLSLEESIATKSLDKDSTKNKTSKLKKVAKREIGRKVYKCNFWHLTFAQMTWVIAHEKTHDADLPDEETFTQVSDYFDHITTFPEVSDEKSSEKNLVTEYNDNDFTQSETSQHSNVDIKNPDEDLMQDEVLQYSNVAIKSDEDETSQHSNVTIGTSKRKVVKRDKRLENKLLKPFKCAKCHMAFHWIDNLTEHVTLQHKGGVAKKDKKPILCIFCGVAFFWKDDLERHLSLKHACEKPDRPNKIEGKEEPANYFVIEPIKDEPYEIVKDEESPLSYELDN